jgi:hypothetical protein
MSSRYRTRRFAKGSRRGFSSSPHAGIRPRRLRFELLEDRRVLSGVAPQVELFSVSPALFVENQGQWADETVRFLHNGNGANVAMTDSGPVFQVVRRELIDDGAEHDHGGLESDGDSLPDGWPGGFPGSRPDQFDPDRYRTETLVFSASFVGAAQVQPVGLQPSETTFNYFVGDQANWRSDVPAYEIVAYEGLYDGIDLHTWGLRSSLEVRIPRRPRCRLVADRRALRRDRRAVISRRRFPADRSGRRLGHSDGRRAVYLPDDRWARGRGRRAV